MTQQKNCIDFADEMESDLGFIRTLVEAAIDKSHFYLSNRTLLGLHGDILIHQAQEIEGLLVLAERFLDKASENTDSAYELLRAAV